VSLADPATPTITASAQVEGSYVSSRMVGGRIRLVLRSQPEVMTELWQAPDESAAREVLASLDGEALLPRLALDDQVTTLGACGDVMLLADAQEGSSGDGAAGSSGRSMGSDDPMAMSMPAPELTTITTLSIGDSLDELHPVTIQGAADTVYASTRSLYVASWGWDGSGPRTDVHRFELTGDGPAAYTGSGSAPGRLLNQFSLSERGEALRVVTTVDRTGPVTEQGIADRGLPPDDGMSSMPMFNTEARLTVLDATGDSLDEIGHLDGLGVGEEVKSVRFIDDLGYVVTFRTTDPLYALDLSDPRAPRVLGELKIPGFSEYLHPVGDGLLLGVGRQADPETGMDEGFKVSLFDISDPAAMREVDQIVIPEAWSNVGSDHRSFLWDEGRRQAVIPVELAEFGTRSGASSGAIVVRVGQGELRQVANLAHRTQWGAVAPIRAFVVGEDLWTLSFVGLGRTSADEPDGVQLIGF
jgi:hypothetical protein